MNSLAPLSRPLLDTQETAPTHFPTTAFSRRTSRGLLVRPDPESEAETTMALYANPTLTLICIAPDAPAAVSLAYASHVTGVHPEMLRYYCRIGLLGPGREDMAFEPTFDAEAIEEVGRIEHYRRHLGVNRRALPLVCQLWRECERRHIELYFLRRP